MPENAAKPKKSLLARIISLEGIMAAFGLYSLASGLLVTEGEEAATQIFWGVMILCGLGVLIAVRRRDWQKHWEEMEAIAAARSRPAPPETTDTMQTEK